MKRFFLFLVCLSVTVVSLNALERTVGETATTASYVMPFFTNNNTFSSIVQQLYTVSDLGSGAKNISAVKFYATGKKISGTYQAVSPYTRSLKIYMYEADKDSFVITKTSGDNFAKFAFNYKEKVSNKYKPGNLVFEGSVTTPDIAENTTVPYTITFDTPFEWSGTKSIIMTVYDVTKSSVGVTSNLRHILMATDAPRFIHYEWTASSTAVDGYVTDLYLWGKFYSTPENIPGQCTNHKYVNKATFIYTEPVSIDVPSVTVDEVSQNSATLSWDAVEGADSYEIRYGTTSGSLGEPVDMGDVTSYTISGLEPSTRYYYQLRTVVGEDHSAWSDEAYFNTSAHSHDANTFTAWNYTYLPTAAGSYYLKRNITLTGNWEPAGSINLCLNGYTVDFDDYYADIDDDISVAIYDEDANAGVITSSNSVQTILVDDHATFAVYGGNIRNTGTGYAVKVNTATSYFLLGADPAFSSTAANVCLTNNVITIAKALTYTSPVSVERNTVGVFTSGWNTYMSAATPSAYFSNPIFSVARSGNELALVSAIVLYDDEDNSSALAAASGSSMNVTIGRTFSPDYYSTICLPFAVSSAKLEAAMGAGCSVLALESSALSDDDTQLTLNFTDVTSMEAGKPYLIKPVAEVVDPAFESVTLVASPVDVENTHLTFAGLFSMSNIPAANKEVMILTPNNVLKWATGDSQMKAFRAYFRVAYNSPARLATKLRLTRNNVFTATDMIQAEDNAVSKFVAPDGNIVIVKDNEQYNLQGQKIK